MAASRFQAINIDDFLGQNENQNTLKKTLSHVTLLKDFLAEKHQESREIHLIPHADLNRYLSEFIINVRKKDGGEYEPSYLRGLISSFERHLRRHKYGFVIISSPEFADTREAMRVKQKNLKSQGKGAKPMKSDFLSDQEINKLYETNQLGIETPISVINTLWYLNTLHFGIRGGSEEHRQICWGDIQLKHDYVANLDYLEFHERTTKTRTGEDLTNTRICPPRMYAVPNNRDRFPVATYMFYQPDDFCRPYDPFYLAVVTNNKHPPVNERWFLRAPIGKNKLQGIMKTMAEEADLPQNKRFTNTSVRKTLVQKMTDHNVPDTLQVYVTGHKSIGSLNNYRSLSDNHKMAISNILSRTDSNDRNLVLPSTSSSGDLNPVQVHPASFSEMYPYCGSQSVSQNRNTSKSIVEGMFAGSTMNNCSININFNHSSPQINPKRRRIALSDSDTD